METRTGSLCATRKREQDGLRQMLVGGPMNLLKLNLCFSVNAVKFMNLGGIEYELQSIPFQNKEHFSVKNKKGSKDN